MSRNVTAATTDFCLFFIASVYVLASVSCSASITSLAVLLNISVYILHSVNLVEVLYATFNRSPILLLSPSISSEWNSAHISLFAHSRSALLLGWLTCFGTDAFSETWCSLAGTIQPAAQWTTATHAWPFDCYCIIILYPDWRIQHSINWYINFQAVNLTGSMKLTWLPVHWTLWSPVRICSRESTHVWVTFSSLRVVLRV